MVKQTRTYNSWRGMKARCLNPNHKDYPHYGGRGITICSAWLTFEGFYKSMGERPEDKTLDREDNEGNYEPDNCRWATVIEQRRNMRSNINITIDSVTKTMKEWAMIYDISYTAVVARIRRGLDHEQAITTPIQQIVRSKTL